MEESKYLMRIRVLEPLPWRWSLIVGDFLQNLRAALDHLIWQLVQVNGEVPDRGNAFPIFDKALSGRSQVFWDRSVRGLSAAALQIIESCQPHLGGDRPHTLRALRELSNEDKHRILIPAYSAIAEVDQPVFDIVGLRDVGPLERGKVFAGAALKDGDVVLEAPVQVTGPNPEVKFKGEFPFDVAFGDARVGLKGLENIRTSVVRIIELAAGTCHS